MRFQVIEIQVVTGLAQLIGTEPAPKGVAYLTPGKHAAPFVQGWYRNTTGDWQARIFDRSPPNRIVLADLGDCDDLDHAERIFLGPWPKANRIADEAGAPVPRSMYATEYAVVLDGPGYEIMLNHTGEARVCGLVDNELVDFECNTESQAAEKLRELLALRGED